MQAQGDLHLKWIIGTHGSWNQIMGAVWELPAKQHCQISLFSPIFEVNGLDLQCYLAGSSKMAPWILIFFNCHVCQTFILYEIYCYLSSPKSWHNNSFLDRVAILKTWFSRSTFLRSVSKQVGPSSKFHCSYSLARVRSRFEFKLGNLNYRVSQSKVN